MTKYLLAHDFGTSGNKATLYTTDGELVTSRTCFYETDFFNGNWAEQNPENWWKAICDSSQAITKVVNPKDIIAVSFSGQSHGCLAVDKNGRALRNSIIYCDNRSVAQSEHLKQHIGEFDYYKIAGMKLSAILPFAKLMWIRDNEPEIYRQTYKAINAKDYIVSRITGKIVTDVNEASNCGICDLSTGKWSEKIIDISGIDGDKLPEIKPSSYVAGEITAGVSAETGLKVGTPVVIGSGDGGCASIGGGAVYNNSAYVYVGSSAWASLTTSELAFDEKMETSISIGTVPGKYTYYGTMQSACTAYNWLRHNVCTLEEADAVKGGLSPYVLMDQLVEKSPAGANGVIFHPYLMGERAPRWNSNAAASFLGININTKREDLVRAVLEGITYNLRCIFDGLNTISKVDELMIIGGGAKGAVWCQMMADIFNCKINRPRNLDEATSMGAAVIGGIGAGVFKDYTAVDKFIELAVQYKPNPEVREKYNKMYSIFNASYDALLDIYEKFAAL